MTNDEVRQFLRERGGHSIGSVFYYPGYYSTVQIVIEEQDGIVNTPFVRIDNRGAPVTLEDCVEFIKLTGLLEGLQG